MNPIKCDTLYAVKNLNSDQSAVATRCEHSPRSPSFSINDDGDLSTIFDTPVSSALAAAVNNNEIHNLNIKKAVIGMPYIILGIERPIRVVTQSTYIRQLATSVLKGELSHDSQ